MQSPTTLRGCLTALLLTLACAAIVLHVYPHDLPPARHPDLLAVVFYSPAMVFAGRVTLLCLAAFAVLSIAARIARREWLAKAGPFEVERAATISERERDELRERLAGTQSDLARLDEAVRVLDQAFAAKGSRAEEADHATR